MQKIFRISLSKKLFYFFILLSVSQHLSAQEKNHAPAVAIADSSKAKKPETKDSSSAKRSPHKAAVRSSIIPGWGQAYNRKYWKIPIVYAAIGTTGYIFVTNLSTYRELRFAYSARYKAANGRTHADSADYFMLKPEYKIYSPESIRSSRDQFRKYVDYSALFFLVFWGLNVVDAAVDAHLSSFDVSPDISMRFKPGHSEMANTNGLSLVFAFKDKRTVAKLPTFR
jgi:hypothetical protein